MSNITIQNFDDELKTLLQKRADRYGRSPEDEAKEILRAVLKESPLEPPNLAETIAQRFADFGDFELPTVPREPLREPPNYSWFPGSLAGAWERVKVTFFQIEPTPAHQPLAVGKSVDRKQFQSINKFAHPTPHFVFLVQLK